MKLIAGWCGSTRHQAQAVPVEPAKPGGGRLSISEKVTLDLLVGVGTPEKAPTHRSLSAGAGDNAPPEAKSLLESLVKGSEAEALKALRALAAMGGGSNRQVFTSIMKDNSWPEALRTEAARALLETGRAPEKLLAARVLGGIGCEAGPATL